MNIQLNYDMQYVDWKLNKNIGGCKRDTILFIQSFSYNNIFQFTIRMRNPKKKNPKKERMAESEIITES